MAGPNADWRRQMTSGTMLRVNTMDTANTEQYDASPFTSKQFTSTTDTDVN